MDFPLCKGQPARKAEIAQAVCPLPSSGRPALCSFLLLSFPSSVALLNLSASEPCNPVRFLSSPSLASLQLRRPGQPWTQRFNCLCLQNSVIKGKCHPAWLQPVFLEIGNICVVLVLNWTVQLHVRHSARNFVWWQLWAWRPWVESGSQFGAV